jgi:hypothetical protein
MLRAPTACVLALSSLALIACNKNDKEPSTEPLELIPAELHGAYGRTQQDSPGMTVSATGLEFGEMQMIIHEGKMEGDTVRIERATLQWQKLEPKTCTGTLSRQKDRLLMSLYEVGGNQAECEKLLDAEWFHWQPLTELPEPLQGRYNVLSIASKELKIELGWFEAKMVTDKIYELPGSNDVRVELLVDEGKVVHEDEDGEVVETPCTGIVKLDGGWLSTDFWVPTRFEPKPGEEDLAIVSKFDEHSRICADWKGRAQKFEVDLANLPKAAVERADVSLAITPDKVVLDSPALRCEQDLWGTESITSRPGLFGGERMTLGKAEPTNVSDRCRLNMRIWCERDQGNDTSALDASVAPSDEVADCMAELEHNLCPDSITVQAISDIRYKLGVEPRLFNEIACVDTTGDFSVRK